MVILPESEYVERRGQGYYLAGTRISLDSVAYGVRRGQTVAEIHDDFPALESRQKLVGAVEYVKAHPMEIDAYLAETEAHWEELAKQNPPDYMELVRRHRKDAGLKSA